MKIAILSVSEKGKGLSSKLEALLKDDPTIIRVDSFHKNIKSKIAEIFNEYDAIIGIMASGILIRTVCNKLNSKSSDPGIISMDENGKFVISLVSGHLGRANEISKKIAKLLNSQEVITTATDSNNKIGIDTLANKYYWKISQTKDILIFNKAILEGKVINLAIGDNVNYISDYISSLTEYKLINKENSVFKKNSDFYKNSDSNLNSNSNLSSDSNLNSNSKLSSDSNLNSNDIIAIFNNHYLNIRPQKLVLGIGARKGISKDKVLIAIKEAMSHINLPLERIDYLGTVDIKKNEKGILDAAIAIKKPLEIVSSQDISDYKDEDINISEFVKEKFNIPGVAEPSALIVAGDNSKLICKRIAIDGVTVAIAISQ